MYKYVIVITVLDVDSHFGITLYLPVARLDKCYYVCKYHCITQKSVNQLTAGYWLPVNQFWICCQVHSSIIW